MPLWQSYMYTNHGNGTQQDMHVHKYNSQSSYMLAVQEVLPAYKHSTTSQVHRSNMTAYQELISNLTFPDVS
jgi:hypothetical protein